jgi:hypothetical protein
MTRGKKEDELVAPLFLTHHGNPLKSKDISLVIRKALGLTATDFRKFMTTDVSKLNELKYFETENSKQAFKQ